MPTQISRPTPYADVNALLVRLLADVRVTLGGRLTGMYLRGSLASGDFDPRSSDVDVLVVTEGALGADAVTALAAMHERLAASGLPWAKHLECSYWPRNDVRRYDPVGARFPEIGEDKPFGLRQHNADWVIELHIAREHGVTLTGPPPHELIDPVSPEQLRAAVRSLLSAWWTEMLDQPEWFRERRYQAFAVLSMCRALYTLEHAGIVSKPAAAAWARAALGEEWATLIERALEWRHDPTPDDPTEALAFVRFAIAHSRAATD